MKAPSSGPDGRPRNSRITGLAIARASSEVRSWSVAKFSVTPTPDP